MAAAAALVARRAVIKKSIPDDFFLLVKKKRERSLVAYVGNMMRLYLCFFIYVYLNAAEERYLYFHLVLFVS